MERSNPSIRSWTEEPALRDADTILASVLADEAAADAARERYRTEPMSVLQADEQVRALLVRDEHVVAIRRSAVFERRQPAPGARDVTGVAVTLYVTSRRLVLIGAVILSFPLAAIVEAILSGERLLLLLRDGQGLTLDVQQPRLLRVELAAARAAGQPGGERDQCDQPLAR